MPEHVLPRRVVPQPSPVLSPGGDCGACVLGGLLEISDLLEVYRRFGPDKNKKPGNVDCLSWWDMRQALYSAESAGLIDRRIIDVPIWLGHMHDSQAVFGLPGYSQGMAWFAYVRMALDAGYYGLALVDSGRHGVAKPLPDHWVLIVGARVVHPPPGECGCIKDELLVSNSNGAPAGQWVERDALLRDWGAYNLFLARPTERP